MGDSRRRPSRALRGSSPSSTARSAWCLRRSARSRDGQGYVPPDLHDLRPAGHPREQTPASSTMRSWHDLRREHRGDRRRRIDGYMTFLGLGRATGPALIDGATGTVRSHRELAEEARAWTAPLGVSKALVFVLCRNNVTTCLAYAGARLGGHAVALLDGQASDEASIDLARVYEATWGAGPAGVPKRR